MTHNFTAWSAAAVMALAHDIAFCWLDTREPASINFALV